MFLFLLSICAVPRSATAQKWPDNMGHSRGWVALGTQITSSLRHSSLSSGFPPDILSLLGHTHQCIQEFEICSPTAADGIWISCHYTHIHRQCIYTPFPQQFSARSFPDWWSLLLLTFKSPCFSGSCFGFMVPAAANSHICLFIISLVVWKHRIFHQEG